METVTLTLQCDTCQADVIPNITLNENESILCNVCYDSFMRSFDHEEYIQDILCESCGHPTREDYRIYYNDTLLCLSCYDQSRFLNRETSLTLICVTIIAWIIVMSIMYAVFSIA